MRTSIFFQKYYSQLSVQDFQMLGSPLLCIHLYDNNKNLTDFITSAQAIGMQKNLGAFLMIVEEGKTALHPVDYKIWTVQNVRKLV